VFTHTVPITSTIYRPIVSSGGADQQAEEYNRSCVYNFATTDGGIEVTSDDVPEEYRRRFELPFYADEAGKIKFEKHSVQLSVPADVVRPTRFHYCPRIYRIDDQLDPDCIRKHNYGCGWEDALGIGINGDDGEVIDMSGGGGQQQQAFGRPGFFYSPFPRERYVYGSDSPNPWNFVDLTFTLHSQSIKHRDFYSDYCGPGKALVLKINKEQLRETLGKIVQLDRLDYHLMPFQIYLKSVHSSIPIHLVCSLKSTLSPVSLHHDPMLAGSPASQILECMANPPKPKNYSTNFVDWYTSPGSCSSQQPGSMGTGGVVIHAGQKGFLNASDPSTGLLVYSANSLLYNNPDFSRWIGVDFKELRDTLKRMVTKPDGQCECYRFTCPMANLVARFELYFWIFVEYFPLICSRTPGHVQNDERVRPNRVQVDRLTTERYVIVVKKVYDDIVERMERMFNKDLHLMNVNELVLVVRPLNGDPGWQDYLNIMKSWELNNTRTHNPEREFVDFTATFTMAFEPFSMTTANNKTDDSQSSASSARYGNTLQPPPIQPFYYAHTPGMELHSPLMAYHHGQTSSFSASSPSAGGNPIGLTFVGGGYPSQPMNPYAGYAAQPLGGGMPMSPNSAISDSIVGAAIRRS
jgi:hypothetical protein